MKCTICKREAIRNSYCELHMTAYENIVNKYKLWKKALDFPWKDYLSAIVKNSLTGERVKEVASYLIKTGEKEDVTKN